MTSTLLFIAIALVLTLIVLTLLCYPLLKKAPPPPVADTRQQARLEIFRDQLQELERDRDHGLLASADFEQAKSELQRRLLDEVPPSDSASLSSSAGKKRSRTLLALSLIVPLSAATGYLLLGNPQAMETMAQAAHPQEGAAGEEIDGMLRGLSERLKKNPDDHKGWIMLARSYKVLGRFAEAAEAYSHGGPLLANEASLLADYAEVLARASQGKFDSKIESLLAQSLKLNPDEGQALFLAGVIAEEKKDFATAITHWQRLLKQFEPGTEDFRMLEASIAELKTMTGKDSGQQK